MDVIHLLFDSNALWGCRWQCIPVLEVQVPAVAAFLRVFASGTGYPI